MVYYFEVLVPLKDLFFLQIYPLQYAWNVSRGTNVFTKPSETDFSSKNIKIPFIVTKLIEGTNKSVFETLLSLATQELYFIFNDVLYKQKLTMGLSFGPTVINVF